MNIEIRQATATDVATLARCIDRAYAPFAARIPDLPDVSAGLATEIADNLVFAAVSNTDTDTVIVGGMVLVRAVGHLHLANIAVDPVAKGCGVGRLLMDHADHVGRQLGYTELELSTHVLMPDNLSLYEHLGWRTTGRAGNKVHMAKTI